VNRSGAGESGSYLRKHMKSSTVWQKNANISGLERLFLC